MAIFKSANISFDSKNSDTVIGTRLIFQGTLTAKGSLRVDGRIDGSIVDAKLVTIGKREDQGRYLLRDLLRSGEVAGNVTALDHIELLAGAKMTGDLRAVKILIEEGAVFNGNCSMTGLKNPKAENSEKAAKYMISLLSKYKRSIFIVVVVVFIGSIFFISGQIFFRRLFGRRGGCGRQKDPLSALLFAGQPRS